MCLTANHRNASFDLLEKLSFGAESAADGLVRSDEPVSGAVVLATCNRFEAYLEVGGRDRASAEAAVDATVSAMSESSGVDLHALRDTVAVLHGDDVVEHLFAVSSGLESVVVGEDEISGQVRRALERARRAGTTSSGLEQLFQRASTTSRAVKSTTAVGASGRSLVRLALDLASSRITDWADRRILLVGTGSYARTTLAALADRGATRITVYSPSGRAEAFAAGRGLSWTTDLGAALTDADVIVTCTTVARHVITPEVVGSGRRRLIIDLGLPRNVDPAVAAADGIELLDLETIRLHAPLEELRATTDARAVVGRAAAAFSAAELEQIIAPAVVALRKHVLGLVDAEIARAQTRGDSSAQTDAALRHLAGVILHTPSVRARELARAGEADEFVAGLSALFGVEADAADSRSAAGDQPATA